MDDEYNDLWELDRPVLVTIVTELRAELSAAQAAQAQAERERDEARGELEKTKNNNRQLWDMAGKATDETMCLMEAVDKKNETIRALVVAARAMWRYIAYIQKWLGSPKIIAVNAIMQEIAWNADRQSKE